MWAYTQDAKLMADDVALAYRRRGFKVTTTHYVHSFNALTVASLNAAATDTIQQDPDGFFVWIATCASKRVGPANSLLNGFPLGHYEHAFAGLSIRLRDLATSYEPWGQQPIPSECVCGSAESPYILGFPYILVPGARMRLDAIHTWGTPGANNFNAVTDPANNAIVFQMSLLGMKLKTDPFTRLIYQPEV